jgi:predicted lipid-binding transport protein (Tim44 family)
MKRSLAVISLVVLMLSGVLMVAEAWARAGGGGSSGSRGSRSYSAPMRPSSPGPVTPARPAGPASGFDQPGRSGWGRGLMGGLAGFALGGLLGGLLFGGLGGGFGGGIGLLDILIIGALVMFGISWLRRRQAQVPAGGSGYTAPPQDRAPAFPAGWSARDDSRSQAAAVQLPAAPSDLDRGVDHIRQMDGSFDPARIGEMASDAFFKVQAAWMARDMAPVRGLLTPEMHASLQQQCEQLRAAGRVNRLENIALRSAQLTEAWQEGGHDYATVLFLANVLDYTTDEDGRQVLEGSRTEPVKFEEFWTFARPVGPNPWKVSAIQQAA